MPNQYEAIVLGAGVTGLVSASVLKEQGCDNILVLDEYSHVGGNHIDRAIGGYTFDIGSLIFQDDSPFAVRFPELLENYVEVDPAWARLNPRGAITAYPFSVRDDIIAPGPIEWVRIGASLIWSRLTLRRQRNARDFAFFWIGARLARGSGLIHYMERFCGLPAEQIDLTFAKSRMMWIAEHARIKKQLRAFINARRTQATETRTNQQLARPREGFESLYEPVVRRLAQAEVDFELGVSLIGIEKQPDGFVVRTSNGEKTAGRIISTVPIDRALQLAGISSEPLPTVTLVSLFYSFSGNRGFDVPILYNFSETGTWKRLTVYSDFYGVHDGREYFGVEVVDTTGTPNAEDAAAAFRKHTEENGLFSGDLRLEGDNTLANAYPIFTQGSGERAQEAIDILRSFGIESFGRQGGFEYQPTARTSTLKAEASLQSPPAVPTTGRTDSGL